MIKLFTIVILASTFLIGCSQKDQVIINGNHIVVEIADEPQEQALGLMHREFLEENAGMLFIFDNELKRTFWMKSTLIPLDMIFISSDQTIVDIKQAEPCKEDPCSRYTSEGDAKYVLEVNRGYAQQKGIKKGDTAVINLKKTV